MKKTALPLLLAAILCACFCFSQGLRMDARAEQSAMSRPTCGAAVQEGVKKGNATAMPDLGFMYDKGMGVEQSLNRAIEYLRLAADQGLEDVKKKLEELEAAP